MIATSTETAKAATGPNPPDESFLARNRAYLLLAPGVLWMLLFLVVPLLMPTVLGLGIDPVHFGVVSVFNMMIGILTPPFGGALFVVSRISGIPYHRLAVSIIPFILPLIGLLILMILVPEISTGVPQLLR